MKKLHPFHRKTMDSVGWRWAVFLRAVFGALTHESDPWLPRASINNSGNRSRVSVGGESRAKQQQKTQRSPIAHPVPADTHCCCPSSPQLFGGDLQALGSFSQHTERNEKQTKELKQECYLHPAHYQHCDVKAERSENFPALWI